MKAMLIAKGFMNFFVYNMRLVIMVSLLQLDTK